MITPPKTKDALLSVDNAVATLTFDRDDVRNAITGTHLLDDICDTVDWVNSASGIQCLVITGNGKGFCSGGNVVDMKNKSGMFGGTPAELAENYRRGIQRMSLAMHRIEIPTIAAVNGAAIGAGFDLACMCDIRLGCEHTRFGETFINLGLIPGDGGAWFLQRLIGYQRAAELTFSGRIIDVTEAQELGLLLQVVASGELLESAHSLAEHFARQPPQALRMSKRLMKSAQRLELDDFLDLCSSYQASCHHAADHDRALDAFLNKQEGEYTGQ